MTFSPDRGGVFDVFLGLVRHGMGGRQGPATQFVSWIHEADFCRAIDLLIASRRVRRQQSISHRRIRCPIPISCGPCARPGAHVSACPLRNGLLEIGAWLLRTESELILKSRRVVPGRLLAAGFPISLSRMACRRPRSGCALAQKQLTPQPAHVTANLRRRPDTRVALRSENPQPWRAGSPRNAAGCDRPWETTSSGSAP